MNFYRPTPRTDEAIQSWKEHPDRLECVDAVFARVLELELRDTRNELNGAIRDKDEWMSWWLSKNH